MIPLAQLRSAVDVIESVYQSPPSEWATWTSGVAEMLRPILDQGEGVLGWCYDVQDLTALKLEHIALLGISDNFLPALARFDADPRSSVKFRRSHYLTVAGPVRLSFGMSSGELEPPWEEHLRPLGFEDILCINAMNFGFRGCAFSSPSRTRLAREPVREALLARVAAHLVSAFRLRTLADTSEDFAEAVVEPGGKIAHAEGDARAVDSRVALSRAARAIELARGKLRRADPEESLSLWHSMVDGRWTLVDQFESDGRRYLVAKINRPTATAIGSLSDRESQAAALASVGHSNKVIAYELGLAEGTVATLLARACKKLGASAVGELPAKISPNWAQDASASPRIAPGARGET
jgi:DNA-binding CsgD family transcriptional regulator